MDVFKRDSFWERKRPFYKRPDFWIVIIAVAIAMTLLIPKNDSLITANAITKVSDRQVQDIQMGFGDKVIINGISYQIKKVDKEAAIPLGIAKYGGTLVADGMFYLLRFELTNTNEIETTLGVPVMWIVSNDGKDMFAPRKDLEARFKSTMTDNEAIGGKATIERVRIFDVSPGLKDLQLLIDVGDTRYYIPISKQ